ncbi:hypothetical protein [Streptomyces ossamyceticus]|uniref:Uncharacterized protein n=1 Tax=Streptomyces ossamyceticus TaxID=249581 RepID=A0ABV2V3I5_9ACTN
MTAEQIGQYLRVAKVFAGLADEVRAWKPTRTRTGWRAASTVIARTHHISRPLLSWWQGAAEGDWSTMHD